jgi:hypothetical protein
MSFYEESILPYLLQLVMHNRYLVPYRRRTVSAQGQVLEIGIGSGLNLPFYRADVAEIFGLDPSPRLITMAEHAARALPRPSRSSKVRPKQSRWMQEALIPS